MSLKGGTITIKGSKSEIENIILTIIADKTTSIELLSENRDDPVFIYKLRFNSLKYSNYFKYAHRTSRPSVLIIKILTHQPYYDYKSHKFLIHKAEYDLEVGIHKHLTLSKANYYAICPSFLYSTQESLSHYRVKRRTLGAVLRNKLEATIQEISVYVDGERYKQQHNLYARLSSETMRQIKKVNPKLQDIKFNFEDTIQTIIVMEYADCKTLDSILNKTDNYDESYISNLHGMKLDFVGTLSERKIGFICFVSLYMLTLLVKAGVIHADLHIGNMLVCKDNEGLTDVVVIDFGRSCYLNNTYFHKNRVIENVDIENVDIERIIHPKILAIYRSLAKRVNLNSKRKSWVKLGMQESFNKLIAKEDYLTLSIESTMLYSGTEHKKKQDYSMFDYYTESIIKRNGQLYYEYVYKYPTLSYDFNMLIKKALEARKELYDTRLKSIVTKTNVYNHTISAVSKKYLNTYKRKDLKHNLIRYTPQSSRYITSFNIGDKYRIFKHLKKTKKRKQN
jgi:hypothetical protein